MPQYVKFNRAGGEKLRIAFPDNFTYDQMITGISQQRDTLAALGVDVDAEKIPSLTEGTTLGRVMREIPGVVADAVKSVPDALSNLWNAAGATGVQSSSYQGAAETPPPPFVPLTDQILGTQQPVPATPPMSENVLTGALTPAPAATTTPTEALGPREELVGDSTAKQILDTAVGAWQQGALRTAKDLFSTVPQMLSEIDSLQPPENFRPPIDANMGSVWKAIADKTGPYFDDLAKNYAAQVPDYAKTTGDITQDVKNPYWWLSGVTDAAQSMAPAMATGLGVGALTEVPMLAALAAGTVGGAQEGIGQFTEAKAQGKDSARAINESIGMGLGSAALNTLGFERLMRKMPPGLASQIIGRLVAGATEGTTEALEEPWSDIVGGKMPNADTVKRMLQVGLPSAVLGLVASGNNNAENTDTPAPAPTTKPRLADTAVGQLAQDLVAGTGTTTTDNTGPSGPAGPTTGAGMYTDIAPVPQTLADVEAMQSQSDRIPVQPPAVTPDQTVPSAPATASTSDQISEPQPAAVYPSPAQDTSSIQDAVPTHTPVAPVPTDMTAEPIVPSETNVQSIQSRPAAVTAAPAPDAILSSSESQSNPTASPSAETPTAETPTPAPTPTVAPEIKEDIGHGMTAFGSSIEHHVHDTMDNVPIEVQRALLVQNGPEDTNMSPEEHEAHVMSLPEAEVRRQVKENKLSTPAYYNGQRVEFVASEMETGARDEGFIRDDMSTDEERRTGMRAYALALAMHEVGVHHGIREMTRQLFPKATHVHTQLDTLLTNVARGLGRQKMLSRFTAAELPLHEGMSDSRLAEEYLAKVAQDMKPPTQRMTDEERVQAEKRLRQLTPMDKGFVRRLVRIVKQAVGVGKFRESEVQNIVRYAVSAARGESVVIGQAQGQPQGRAGVRFSARDGRPRALLTPATSKDGRELYSWTSPAGKPLTEYFTSHDEAMQNIPEGHAPYDDAYNPIEPQGERTGVLASSPMQVYRVMPGSRYGAQGVAFDVSMTPDQAERIGPQELSGLLGVSPDMITEQSVLKRVGNKYSVHVNVGSESVAQGVRSALSEGSVQQRALPGVERSDTGSSGVIRFSASMPVRDELKREPFTRLNTTTVDRAQVERTLATHFGITRNPKEAGYVLSDGRMLDLTGRHYSTPPAPGERDYLANQRSVDHRELPEGLPEGGFDSIHGVTGRGVARVDFSNGFVHLSDAPTPRQESAIIGAVEKVNAPYVQVELTDPNNGSQQFYAEIDEPNPVKMRRAFNDVKRVVAGEDTAHTLRFSAKKGQGSEKNLHEVNPVSFSADPKKLSAIRNFLDNGEPVAELTGNEFQKSDLSLAKRVAEWFQSEHNNVATNPILGDVALTLRGVKDSIAHGIGREKAAAFAAVPGIISKGMLADSQQNWKGRKYDSFVVVAPFTMGGKEYVGEVVVHRTPETQRFYLHEVQIKEKLHHAFKTGAFPEGRKPGAGEASISSLLERIYSVKGQGEDVNNPTDAGTTPDTRLSARRGRPDLANPGTTPEQRDVVDTVDESRNQAGQPEPRHDDEVNTRADELGRDPEAVVRRLLDTANGGGQLSDVETVAAQRIVSQRIQDALEHADPVKTAEAAELVDAWRRTGTEQARAFRQRRDRMMTPAQRNALVIGEEMLKPKKATEKQLDTVRDKLNGTALTDMERKRYEAELKRLKARHLVEINELKEKLAKFGYTQETITEALKDDNKAAEIYRETTAHRGDMWDALHEFWLNSLLSGTVTHARNITGNTAAAGWDFTFQRTAEAMVNLVVQDPHSAQFGEFRYILAGMRPGFARAWRNALASFRTERPMFMDEVKPGETRIETSHGAAISGKKGRFIRTPGRSLLFMDEFFKSMIGQMQVGAEAYRIAKSEGFKGDDIARRVEDLTSDYESPAWDKAIQKALELTFQGETGTIAETIKYARDKIPGARYIVPFINTPANIFSMAVRKSPAGVIGLMTRVAKDGRMYDKSLMTKHIAEQLLALGVTAGLMSLIWPDDDDEPVITGSKQFKNGSAPIVEPMTIKIGDTRYNYSGIEPMATMLAITVDGINAVKRAKNGEDFSLAAGMAYQSFMSQLRDKTYMRGLGDLLDALDDPSNLGRWVGNFASSWVPNLIRSTARATDSSIREQRVWGKSSEWGTRLLNRVEYRALPIAANAPPPKVNRWGREITKDTGASPATDFLWRITSPVETYDLTDKSVPERNLDRMLMNYLNEHPEWTPPTTPEPFVTVDGKHVALSDQAYHDYIRDVGKRALELLSGQNFNYDSPTELDIKRVQKAFDTARKWPRNRLKRDIRQEGQNE